jgi:tetratricopeptide (TPR) repeat protein
VIRRGVFDGLLLLFLLSAAFGAWLAYNQAAGWGKFLLIVGGVGIYSGITQMPEHIYVGSRTRLSLFCLLFILLPSVISAYFLVSNNWLGEIGNPPAWQDPLRRWLGGWQPSSWHGWLHSNQAAGMIAAFLPLQIAAIATTRHSRRAPSWVAVILLCLSAIGLLMSGSRGAWLVLMVVAFGWCSWLLGQHLASHGHTSPILHSHRKWWIVALVVGGAIIFLIVLIGPLDNWLPEMSSDRLTLWRNSLDLANDYLFSGLGLASFEMNYSSYVLLLQVGYLTHAHNLLLDVWLGQGILGLLALIWLFAVAIIWQGQSQSRWTQPALASLGVVLLHGLIDDSLYGYNGIGILLLFVPFALLAKPAELTDSATEINLVLLRSGSSVAFFLLGLGLVLLTSAGMLLLLPDWQAALQANLGALAQSRAELSVYRWPEWPIQDAVRRSSEINLAPALNSYRAALALNPANVSANRRLGQVELSLGHYETARKHLETAYAIAPDQRATRQMLGESYAVTGDIKQAAVLWRTIDSSLEQLELRRWWHDYIGEPQQATWIYEAVQESLSPPPETRRGFFNQQLLPGYYDGLRERIQRSVCSSS